MVFCDCQFSISGRTNVWLNGNFRFFITILDGRHVEIKTMCFRLTRMLSDSFRKMARTALQENQKRKKRKRTRLGMGKLLKSSNVHPNGFCNCNSWNDELILFLREAEEDKCWSKPGARRRATWWKREWWGRRRRRRGRRPCGRQWHNEGRWRGLWSIAKQSTKFQATK